LDVASAKRVADALGLHVHSRRISAHFRIAGRVDGLEVLVRVPQTHLAFDVGAIAVSVDALGAIPKRVVIEVPRRTQRKAITGDPRFDERVGVQGRELDAAAMLGQLARESLLDFMPDATLVIADGVLRTDLPWRADADYAPSTILAVQELVSLARALAFDREHIPARLLANALGDREPGVRGRCFGLLLAHYPHSEQARAACEHHIDASDHELRISAAKHLGAAGASVLRVLLMQRELDERLRMVALDHLSAHHPENLPEEAWLAAQIGAGSDAMQVSLARALGLRKFGDVEAGLLAFLKDHPSLRVKISIAEELALAGSVRAVEHLLPFARGFFVDTELKNTAREAVEAIQARLGETERGTLSLAERSSAGELSLPEAGPGALSKPR
jgi:hypothetical protein